MPSHLTFETYPIISVHLPMPTKALHCWQVWHICKSRVDRKDHQQGVSAHIRLHSSVPETALTCPAARAARASLLHDTQRETLVNAGNHWKPDGFWQDHKCIGTPAPLSRWLKEAQWWTGQGFSQIDMQMWAKYKKVGKYYIHICVYIYILSEKMAHNPQEVVSWIPINIILRHV